MCGQPGYTYVHFCKLTISLYMIQINVAGLSVCCVTKCKIKYFTEREFSGIFFFGGILRFQNGNSRWPWLVWCFFYYMCCISPVYQDPSCSYHCDRTKSEVVKPSLSELEPNPNWESPELVEPNPNYKNDRTEQNPNLHCWVRFPSLLRARFPIWREILYIGPRFQVFLANFLMRMRRSCHKTTSGPIFNPKFETPMGCFLFDYEFWLHLLQDLCVFCAKIGFRNVKFSEFGGQWRWGDHFWRNPQKAHPCRISRVLSH